MPRHSAGLLLYRTATPVVEVFIVHPGGPFWKNKDDGAWSIPKGEHEVEDEPIAAAFREFQEEVGTPPPVSADDLIELGAIKQRSGKLLAVWAAPGDVDADDIKSNTFELEWPPKSGRTQEFPEVDRAGWFTLAGARQKLLPGHVEFLDRLADYLKAPADQGDGHDPSGSNSQATLFDG